MMEPVKITVKKPIWSTEVVDIFGKGSIIHNYADGTNSGPLPIDRSGPYPVSYGENYIRTPRGTKDAIVKVLEEINGDLP